MIIARIESLIMGKGVDDAFTRAKAYLEAGADGIMIHNREKTPDEIFEFCKLYNKLENRKALVAVPHGLACSFTLRELLKNNIDGIVNQPHERLVLVAVLNLLESLNLREKVRAYLSAETIMDLQAEMETKGRADNFIGKMSHGLDELLNSSLN